MDDIHSKENCLTLPDVEDLFADVESQIGTIKSTACNTEQVSY